MTMGIALNYNNSVYVAADRRVSFYQNSEFKNVVSDDVEKLIKISENSVLFVGGLSLVTNYLKDKVTKMISENQMNTLQNIKSNITSMCKEAYEKYNDQIRSIKLDVGSLICLLVTYDRGPVQFGFMIEYNFEPLEYRLDNYINLKSSNDDLAVSVIKETCSVLNLVNKFNPVNLLRMTFQRVSKHVPSIGPVCDIYKVCEKGAERCD